MAVEKGTLGIKETIQTKTEQPPTFLRLVFLNEQNIHQYVNVVLPWLQHENVAPHLKDVPQTSEEVMSYYSAENLHGFIAVDNQGIPVGVFGLREPAEPDATYCTLERFVVDPTIHSNGKGKSMLREAVRYAFDGLNFDEIRLNVGMGVENDAKTVKFYTNAGFQAGELLRGQKHIGFVASEEEAKDAAQFSGRGYRQVENNRWEVVADKTPMSLRKADWELLQQPRRSTA